MIGFCLLELTNICKGQSKKMAKKIKIDGTRITAEWTKKILAELNQKIAEHLGPKLYSHSEEE